MPFSVRNIGACAAFAIFGSSAVTFDGEGSIVSKGNIGIAPGTSITVATGTIRKLIKNGIEEVNTLNAGECSQRRLEVIWDGQDATCGASDISVLDRLTLPPGIYCFETFSLSAGAIVTLDGTNGCLLLDPRS
jgi:hypothetical protein